MIRCAIFAVCLFVISLLQSHRQARAAELAMGFRVGEVTQQSAIVWVRVTKNKDRNWVGFREPKKREPRVIEYTPSKVKVANRHGEVVGAAGQVRLEYVADTVPKDAVVTAWVSVKAEHDFCHQFRLRQLQPGVKYDVRVFAREDGDGPETATASGSFKTPAAANKWQDVNFTVITGQSYWDLDHKDGFHIYPAMQKLKPSFIVPTGDTVYMDSESPRARTVELARFHWHRMCGLPRLVEFHRHVPGYWEVDDHDSWCNDDWPTMKAPWMDPLTFERGFKIYREQVPMGDKTFRTVRWGKGLQVWMVEGRLYRSPNTMKDGPDKTIWGKEQLAWLKRTILASDADFRVLISPTPIVGPDREKGKNDNHSNKAFAYEGNHFRNWTKKQGLKNFYVCCGDRHWQYMSVEPHSGLREFSCGPASDQHAGGNPQQPDWQPFLRVQGGFLEVSVSRVENVPTIHFRHRDVHGRVMHTFTSRSEH